MVEHQASLIELASTNDVTKIRILDSQGKILRSSSEEEHGNIVNPGTLNNLNSFLSGQDPFGTYFVKQPSRIQEFRSIENKKECFGCHDPSLKHTGILEVSIDYAPAAILLRKSQTQAVMISLFALGILQILLSIVFLKKKILGEKKLAKIANILTLISGSSFKKSEIIFRIKEESSTTNTFIIFNLIKINT